MKVKEKKRIYSRKNSQTLTCSKTPMMNPPNLKLPHPSLFDSRQRVARHRTAADQDIQPVECLDVANAVALVHTIFARERQGALVAEHAVLNRLTRHREDRRCEGREGRLFRVVGAGKGWGGKN